MVGGREKIGDDRSIRKRPDLGAIGRHQPTQVCGEGGGFGATLGLGQRCVAIERGAKRFGTAVGGDELLGGVDDPARVGLGLVAGVTPGRDAVAAEDHTDRAGVRLLDGGDVESELESGTTPGNPRHPAAKRLCGERLPVGGGRKRDAGVGVQVVDVCGIHQSVHGRVDRGCGASLAVQGVVERGDHVVFALHSRVDRGQRAHPVEPQHREPALGQGSEIAAGSLHPEQLDGFARRRVDFGAFCRGVAPGVVGDPGVRPQAVAPGEEFCGGWVRHEGCPSGERKLKWGGDGAMPGGGAWWAVQKPGSYAPQEACCPPARASAIWFWYPDAA